MRLILPLIAGLIIIACSDAERDAAADADGNSSLNAETAAAPPAGEGPATIDCQRASGQAEQAVCADRELTAIDRSLGELGGTAVDDAWSAERNACGRADDLRQCLLDLYAARIHDLAAARPKDDGTIVGPVAFRCGNEQLTATFINSDPGAVHLRLDDAAVTLPRVPSASGVRYDGRTDGAAWSFWNKGREAMLIRAGSEASCAESGEAG